MTDTTGGRAKVEDKRTLELVKFEERREDEGRMKDAVRHGENMRRIEWGVGCWVGLVMGGNLRSSVV